MGLLDIFKKSDINAEIKKFRATEGAVLIDVREKDEYAAGHIPGSINIPGKDIQAVLSIVPSPDTPIFVYCLRGSRAARAVQIMKDLGYTNVKNIGGISSYSGPKETFS